MGRYDERKRPLTFERARELFEVVKQTNPETESGLVYRVGRGGRRAGSVAGGIHTSKAGRKHWRVSIDYRLYEVHHVIWLLVTGRLPRDILDHRDRNSLNNDAPNLRECTPKQNARNRSPGRNNTSGVLGVYPISGSRKWGAEIMVDGKAIKLGSFSDLAEAVTARQNAERIHFGEFAPSLVPSLGDMTGGAQ